MAVSKVILNGTTLIDVTDDTVNASNLLSGITATASNCTYGLISTKSRPTTSYYWVKSGTQDGTVVFGGQQ